MLATKFFDTGSNNETVKLLLENRANVDIKNNNNEIFFSLIGQNKKYHEWTDIIYQVRYHEFSMKKILKQLLANYNKIILHPDSISIKIMNIKWEINKCQTMNL